jgi:hypothetical protein
MARGRRMAPSSTLPSARRRLQQVGDDLRELQWALPSDDMLIVPKENRKDPDSA